MFQETNPLHLKRLTGCLQSLSNIHFLLPLLAALLILPGCGGGSSSRSDPAAPISSAPQMGELFVGITDAPGDFLKYSIDVQSLTLTRDNGDIVETLPLSTRIDFAELTDVTEFLTVATVPVGVYQSVSIRMDFSTAEIILQDENGDSQPANPVDDQGNSLGVMDLRLNLSTNDVIRIAFGVPAAFSLDFDLAASNEVNYTVMPLEVVVEPFLLATPELESDREHRVRGVVNGVDLSANEIDMLVRPFRHRSGQFGSFTLTVNSDTQYEVDGIGYTGSEGLEAIDQLADQAPIVANGRISAAGMTAEIVIAGSSVPWDNADVVRGVVASRAGNVLTVRGAKLEFADGTDAFRGTFMVNLSDTTSVSAPGLDNANVTTESISVGQRVLAWGEFLDDQTLAASRVRMQINQLTAEVVQVDPLAVDLFFLNGRRAAAFDFSGTGMSPEFDADAAFYEIRTGLLPLASIISGDLVRVRGLINAFGAAPEDYLARTIIDVQTDIRAAFLQVGWQDGTPTPFTSIAPERIDVDLSEARRSLSVRGVPRAFIDELQEVALLAPDSGQGVYAVKVRGIDELWVYRSFNDLVDELISQLDAGRLLHRINAQGKYNISSAELTTGRAGFVFSANTAQE